MNKSPLNPTYTQNSYPSSLNGFQNNSNMNNNNNDNNVHNMNTMNMNTNNLSAKSNGIPPHPTNSKEDPFDFLN
jgi:hypothetical protein